MNHEALLSVDGSHSNTLPLSFSNVSDENIELGLLPTALQSLFELPPALRTARDQDRRQRQAEAGVPPLPDALGIFREVARGRQLSQARAEAGGSGPHCPGRKRHGGGPPDAASQAEAVCQFPFREHAVLNSRKRAVEMTDDGKRGKPKPGFPSFPTALGNRSAIPTIPQPRRRFSPCQNSKSKSPKGAPATQKAPTPVFRLILR